MSHRYHLSHVFILFVLLIALSYGCGKQVDMPTPAPSLENETTIQLPKPQYDSDVSIEQSLRQRRSTRDYTNEPLKLHEVSQLLWATQGITDARGYRTAPSAGALYPLELYIVVGKVEHLAPGIYKYDPHDHEIVVLIEGDKRVDLAVAALSQPWVKDGALSIVIAAVYERTTVKYGDRGIRYVHIEVGHAAQNLCLQATAMDLGVVTVGAFNDERVSELLNLPDNEKPLYIIPIGRK